MTDPKIVTDADTIARLAKKARAIEKILGDDKLMMITGGGRPAMDAIGEHDPDTGQWVAVTIEGGDVWHYDGTVPALREAAAPTPPVAHDLARCNPDRYWCGCDCPACEGPDGHCICTTCKAHRDRNAVTRGFGAPTPPYHADHHGDGSHMVMVDSGRQRHCVCLESCCNVDTSPGRGRCICPYGCTCGDHPQLPEDR